MPYTTLLNQLTLGQKFDKDMTEEKRRKEWNRLEWQHRQPAV